MTFDIVIATRTPPTRAMVESHLRETGWRLSLEGDLAGDAGDLLAESRGLLRRRPVFVLSGPYPAEREDLPKPVQRVIRGRAYLLEMNVPWSVGQKNLLRAVALCQHLARTCDGAVFDPQDDRLVYPDMPDRSKRRARTLTPIRQLTLEWYFAHSGPEDAARFLGVARQMWLEAVPTRFGPHEPPRFRMADPTGEATFFDHWQPGNPSFYWKSTKPVLGGSIFWSPDRPALPGQHRKVELSVNINATAMENDQAMCERAVSLFLAVAEGLGAFFAAGYVTRGVLTGARGGQSYGHGTENFLNDWITGAWWLGVPPKATWLTWFGEPYRDLVAQSLAGTAVQRDRGLLVRLGPTPMDSDEVRGLAPALPPELLAGMRAVHDNVPVQDTGEVVLVANEGTPATYIPPLG